MTMEIGNLRPLYKVYRIMYDVFPYVIDWMNGNNDDGDYEKCIVCVEISMEGC